jgi:hypothetical protein
VLLLQAIKQDLLEVTLACPSIPSIGLVTAPKSCCVPKHCTHLPCPVNQPVSQSVSQSHTQSVKSQAGRQAGGQWGSEAGRQLGHTGSQIQQYPGM